MRLTDRSSARRAPDAMPSKARCDMASTVLPSAVSNSSALQAKSAMPCWSTATMSRPVAAMRSSTRARSGAAIASTQTIADRSPIESRTLVW